MRAGLAGLHYAAVGRLEHSELICLPTHAYLRAARSTASSSEWSRLAEIGGGFNRAEASFDTYPHQGLGLTVAGGRLARR